MLFIALSLHFSAFASAFANKNALEDDLLGRIASIMAAVPPL